MDTLKQAYAIILQSTGGRKALWPLAGDTQRRNRRAILELLTGGKVTMAKAGYNAMEAALFNAAECKDGCIADKEDQLFQKMNTL